MTIKDIARIAKVSVSTVSRVINNDSTVSTATAKKVLKIIAENHYQPSRIARGMVSKKTNMIAVVVSDITNPYFNQFVAILEKALLKSGYTLSLFDSQTAKELDKDVVLKTEIQIINQIRENKFDAAIILGGLIDRITVPKDYISALQNLANETPLLIVGPSDIPGLSKGNELIYLKRDQVTATKLLINYMLKLKYRNFFFIGGNKSSRITRDRVSTFKQTLLENDLPISDQNILFANYYFQDGYNAAKYVVENKTVFDAVIASNDRVATGFLRGIKDLTALDFSEFGLGSCEYFEEAAFSIPRITSVDHNMTDLSTLTIELLRSLLEKQDNRVPAFYYSPKLIIGESC
ncbi:LacI family DNA-binding transcriptional regulator [Lactovum odontotermitis]